MYTGILQNIFLCILASSHTAFYVTKTEVFKTLSKLFLYMWTRNVDHFGNNDIITLLHSFPLLFCVHVCEHVCNNNNSGELPVCLCLVSTAQSNYKVAT